ncbi:phosphoenolpyruvate synthase [Larkinella harenae]
MKQISTRILSFEEVGQSKIDLVGGKGANLGELSRLEGVHMPGGFIITTEVYREIIGNNDALQSWLDQLNRLKPADRQQIREQSAHIRSLIEAITIPDAIGNEIARQIDLLDDQNAYAIRSSATAEDLPTASFAGQQDTYLNVIGKEAILRHISQCWASLFTERAVSYRLQNGVDHQQVQLAVVVQKMVFPQVAGILFTADPVTSNRTVLSIDAGFGLGEALVAGLVNPDTYKVRNGTVIDAKIATKNLAIYALPEGGTAQQAIEPDRQNRPTLTQEQILQLEHLGRTIEAHFNSPQDIEWCLADGTVHIVQSRPITTLYPIPEPTDGQNRVYVSVGHQQMMTDAMKPLGLSLWQLTAGRPMVQAGGRPFVDVTAELASPEQRELLINILGKSDPLIKDALTTLLERGDFWKSPPGEHPESASGPPHRRVPLAAYQTLIENDPALVADLISRSETSLAELKQTIQPKTGTDLIDFIRDDCQQIKASIADPKSFEVIMTAMNASYWINEKMEEWLGERNAADTLSQSVSNNITSEMGLALLDVADVIRPYPDVIRYLQQVKEDSALDELVGLDGGQPTRDAIEAYLNRYGMRCAGEIDITKTRWREKWTILVPLILSNIKNFEPGAGKRRFEQGRQDALKKERELLDRLEPLPDGAQKVRETKRMIDLIRNFAGYREYPKYSIVCRYFVYKQGLLKEAESLVKAGVIPEKEDIYYLTWEELRETVRTHQLDYGIIQRRKDEYRGHEKLTPPRVITSQGEILSGNYHRHHLPAGALPGLAVSSGVREGRARVLLTMENADLGHDDILVTRFTDPSWTPLFVSIKGLVTEVGGLMTHGAVIAREYGLPAVVGVDHATKRIKDGQRIRVHGTEGYVEIL